VADVGWLVAGPGCGLSEGPVCGVRPVRWSFNGRRRHGERLTQRRFRTIGFTSRLYTIGHLGVSESDYYPEGWCDHLR
jgi:hypothetical protein